jgi:hypothetical protein
MPDLPRHLRRAFEELVGQVAESGYVPDAVFARGGWGEVETIGGFLAKFVGCKQRLPTRSRLAVEGLYFQRFGRAPPESRFATYSSASRRLAEVRRGTSALISSRRG